MNKEDYAKYYIQGSDHYLVPSDIFIELINEMINWRDDSKIKSKENKILKENAENNDKAVDKVNFENRLLKQALNEIEELLTEPTLEAIWKIPKCIKIIDKVLGDEHD